MRGGQGVVLGNTIDTQIPYTTRLTDESGCSDSTASYPLPYQIHDAYIWNNSGTGDVEVVLSACEFYIQEGRDYFLSAKSGYSPFSYPHPLR